jgi:hypothetical protein
MTDHRLTQPSGQGVVLSSRPRANGGIEIESEREKKEMVRPARPQERGIAPRIRSKNVSKQIGHPLRRDKGKGLLGD